MKWWLSVAQMRCENSVLDQRDESAYSSLFQLFVHLLIYFHQLVWYHEQILLKSWNKYHKFFKKVQNTPEGPKREKSYLLIRSNHDENLLCLIIFIPSVKEYFSFIFSFFWYFKWAKTNEKTFLHLAPKSVT